MGRKLIIDADPGIGDAIAIAMALYHPEVDLLAVTAVPGVVSGEQATQNLLTLVSLLDPPRWPRLGVASGPAVTRETLDRPSPIAFHGSHGLGDFPRLDVQLHQRHDSAKVMIELVRSHPYEVTLLTLGPLTNVFRAAELYPPFLSELQSLVCQGGAYACAGDMTPTAEYNILADASVARHVLRQPCTKTLVPLDVTQEAVLTFDQYQRLGAGPESRFGQFLAWTIPYALRAARQHLGTEGLALTEFSALISITHPQLFTRESGAVDVELHGELTQGMTVFDRRGIASWQQNIDVLTYGDGRSIVDHFCRQVQHQLRQVKSDDAAEESRQEDSDWESDCGDAGTPEE